MINTVNYFFDRAAEEMASEPQNEVMYNISSICIIYQDVWNLTQLTQPSQGSDFCTSNLNMWTKVQHVVSCLAKEIGDT